MVASSHCSGWSLKALPLGTAYAVWTGIGAVGTAILGMYLFNEARDAARLVCIALIVAGIVGLKLVTPSADYSRNSVARPRKMKKPPESVRR
jgi:quaternary ammonium compound-resistance protein SugE